MKNLFIAGAALAAMSLAVFACSSGDDGGSTSSSSSGGSSSGGSTSSSSGGSGITFSCDTKSKCPNEPAWTDDEKAECQALLSSDCGDEYQAFGDCLANSETCKSDGTSDAEGTRAGACATQTDTYERCLADTHDAGQ